MNFTFKIENEPDDQKRLFLLIEGCFDTKFSAFLKDEEIKGYKYYLKRCLKYCKDTELKTLLKSDISFLTNFFWGSYNGYKIGKRDGILIGKTSRMYSLESIEGSKLEAKNPKKKNIWRFFFLLGKYIFTFNKRKKDKAYGMLLYTQDCMGCGKTMADDLLNTRKEINFLENYILETKTK